MNLIQWIGGFISLCMICFGGSGLLNDFSDRTALHVFLGGIGLFIVLQVSSSMYSKYLDWESEEKERKEREKFERRAREGYASSLKSSTMRS
jgi:hypothetical protein